MEKNLSQSEIVKGLLGALADPNGEVHQAFWDSFPYEVSQQITARLDNCRNAIPDVLQKHGYVLVI